MPYAVNIRADNASASAVRSLWDDCEQFETVPSMRRLRYPPHITLAVYDKLPQGFPDTLGPVFAQTKRLEIKFQALGHFQAPHGIVLWVAPGDSDRLASLHESVHALIDPNLCRLNYQPGRWVPHCSIATAVDAGAQEAALQYAAEAIDPFVVIFDVADCVSFSPVKIMMETQLGVS